jgi:hypothetical protein
MKRLELIFVCILSVIVYSILLWNGTFKYYDLRIFLIGAILYWYIHRSEKGAQQRRALDWGIIRTKGKTRFILFDYVLVRGGFLSAFIILILSLKIPMSFLILYSVLPMLGVTAFAGNEVWKKCEQDYMIMILKTTAEKMRVLQN